MIIKKSGSTKIEEMTLLTFFPEHCWLFFGVSIIVKNLPQKPSAATPLTLLFIRLFSFRIILRCI